MTIERILADAWANPRQGGVYYSTDGAETASPRLNAMTWDWTPRTVRRVGGVSTCMVPLALGCPATFTSEGKEWVTPRITDAAQVDDLEVPPVTEGRTGEVLDNLRALVDQLPADERVREPDIQGPLGVAELMWDESFYIALVEHPDAVHRLLGKITPFIIDFITQVQRIAGRRLVACGFPAIWSPPRGTMVADDTMSLISPAMHREFSLPYLNAISRACGGLYYHSCSWRRPYFDNIRDIDNCIAYNWNPGNSDDPAELIREFGGRAVLALHLVRDMHRDNDVLKLGRRFEDECAFLEYWLDAMTPETTMMVWLSNIRDKRDQVEKIYDMLHRRGHSPAAKGVTR
ncbi:MAG: uroporphyrinogen decarboxylase family protein [Planctomycetota bacterium]